MIDTLNSETGRLLAQGQQAARKGDKAAARTLLTQVVERDPHHELAWMWLSGVVEEPEEQQICLENVMVINPHNDKARRGLDFISTKTGIPPNLPQMQSEYVANDAEFTAPLTADSPMFAELSGLSGHAGQWGSAPNYATPQNGQAPSDGSNSSDPSGAFLAWMQNSGSATPSGASNEPDPYMPQFEAQDSNGSVASQAAPWGGPSEPQPFQQEQLDWSQPDDQFNVMSIADGVDGQLAQFDTSGSGAPSWADADSSGAGGFAESDLPFGVEPFALGAALGAGAGAGAAPVAAMGGMSMMGPMGLHSESQLPSPSELPKFEESVEQPWYLKSDQLSAQDAGGNTNRASDGHSDSSKKSLKSKQQDIGTTMDCPHCKASVADTALTCPQCKFSFFVNCPHCHELVDAIDAKAGKTDNCPHCKKPVNRMELGMAGTDSALSYRSTKSSSDSMSKEAMEQLEASRKVKRQLSFQWAIDVAWLVVIVAAVWALSQLPTWLRLTGQY